ncbi:MAG: O-antigen ligase family protein [bacterium]|nr:O-antigen ligase family protein [bacterium]
MKESNRRVGMLGMPSRGWEIGLWLVTAVGFLWLMGYALPRQPAFAVFMSILGVGIFTLGLLRPAWALVVLLVTIPGITTSTVTVFNRLQPELATGVFGPAAYVPMMAFALGVWARAWLRREPVVALRMRWWLLAFLALSVVSALITCWRYADFWPLRHQPYLEQAVNIDGLRAFEAHIRVVWTLANYVSGPLTFLAVCHAAGMARARAGAGWSWRRWLLRTVLVPLWMGSAAPFLVGRYQTTDVWFGANRVYVWPWMGRINATMFDPNALGAYVILMVPWTFALGLALCAHRRGCTLLMLGSMIAGVVATPWLNRLTGLIGGEHSVGAYLLLGVGWVLVGLAMLVAERWWALLVPCGMACGMVMRMSVVLAGHAGSRTALLGILVSGVAMVVFLSMQVVLQLRRIVPGRVMRLIAAAVAIAYISGGTWLFYEGAPRMRAWVQRQPRVSTLPLVKRLNQLPLGSLRQLYHRVMADRGPYAIIALKMMADAPLTGVGLGAFLTELPNWKQRERQVIYVPDTACNYYLQIGAEQGVIALAVMLLCFGLWWRAWWRVWLAGEARGVVVALGAGMLSMLAMFVFGMHTLAAEIQALFWVYMAQICAADQEEAVPWTSRYRWLLCSLIGVIIVVQSAAQFSLAEQRQRFGWQLRVGFYPTENYGADGVPIRYTQQQAREVIRCEGITFRQPWACFHPGISSTPVQVSFSVGDVHTNVIASDNLWHTLTLSLPCAMMGQEVEYAIRVSRTWTGKEAGLNYDTRPLGVALQNYRWDTASGLYAPEIWMHDGSSMAGQPFRWSSGNARLGMNSIGAFVDLPVLVAHPDVGERPVTVTFGANGIVITTGTYAAQGWHHVRLFVRDIVLASGPWCLEIGVDRTWRPEQFGMNDARVLGIGVGTPSISEQGGFYPVEVWPSGFRYRWAAGTAWWAQQADTNGTVTISYLIDHPDAAGRPVTFVLSGSLATVSNRITEVGWRSITLQGAPLRWYGFSAWVDRTWNPAAYGQEDNRELGFAIRY